MQNNDYELAHHVSQLSRLLYLGQTSKIEHYASALDEIMQGRLGPWLTHTLANKGLHSSNKQQQPFNELGTSAEGWHAYYQNDYLAAHDQFDKIIQADLCQQYSLNCALGLAKVYTRTGHWETARDWCLYYLSLARQNASHFDVAAGYGALAEIFLRASCANEALACFQTAYHLMPAGQGQRSRQYNFLASALLRNKEILRAEVLLHTSRQISRNILELDPDNQEALVSLCHSAMRFYYLGLLKNESVEPVALSLSDNSLIAKIRPDNGLAKAPLGLLQVARGIYYLSNDPATARSQFALAMESFGPEMTMEHQWALRLKASCDSDPVHVDTATLDRLVSLAPIAPPAFDSILDLTWQQVALTNQGFAPLIEARTSTQLAGLRTLFFI